MSSIDIKQVAPCRIIRLPRVRALVGNPSKATIWRWVKKDPTFPKPFRLSSSITCWDEDEISSWVESKKAARGLL